MKEFSIRDIHIELARKVTREKLIKWNSIPFKQDEEYVYVLTNEENMTVINEISFIYERKVKVIYQEKKKIESLIDRIFIGERKDLEEQILMEAIERKASDIHFEPHEFYVLVRLRIDGLLVIAFKIFNKEYQILISKVKNHSNLDITEKRRPQDGKMSINFNDKKYEFRVSIVPVFWGEKIVIRVLYGENFDYSIKQLKLTVKQREKLEAIIKVKNGITIINGPTGSGKSTTLYTILHTINDETCNISTLEDPVEVLIPGVNQVNLNRSINLTFADGIRSLLRQDPDVLMIGEIRDEETAAIAVRASLTGHKVYTTIHTKDPKEVYFRLEEMGIPRYLIRDALVGIVSQRLIRLLCDKCKVASGELTIGNEVVKSYTRKGCINCNNTGYRGRGLALAIHYINREMKKQLIKDDKENQMLSNDEMKDNLIEFLKKGQISIKDYEDFLEMEEIALIDEEKVYK